MYIEKEIDKDDKYNDYKKCVDAIINPLIKRAEEIIDKNYEEILCYLSEDL